MDVGAIVELRKHHVNVSFFFALFLLIYFHPKTPLNGLELLFSSSQNLYCGSISHLNFLTLQ